jgi:TRAP-type C4-dicarboxylate transport system permease small subunit
MALSASGVFDVHVAVVAVLHGVPRRRRALNALTTLLLVASVLAVTIGHLGYRWFTRGEKGAKLDVFAGEA